ncbi:hypothetical protein GLAREA_03975 [Glarea lozoyensis ATCC 20868]|uniref:Uncharacterized protein n=1 Tax=Glarea lozoyensis (strain ATCC 20868 / MF5171) TaxID=1116229 RepID=S3DXA8_GLAL2|nr:uncharacterized protein GLAREA_03975 [Glarea lozoyensis ATCC 20868]EPE31008.1 hypothetical protein GLAREA_03975 [Glarea lozoyensis ATCC 20868]
MNNERILTFGPRSFRVRYSEILDYHNVENEAQRAAAAAANGGDGLGDGVVGGGGMGEGGDTPMEEQSVF